MSRMKTRTKMTRMTQGAALYFGVALVGLTQFACGGSRAPEAASMDEAAGGEEAEAPSVETAMAVDPPIVDGGEWQELLVQDDSLMQSLEMGEVDCSSARDLVESICSLAERVCVIAEDTADGETEERCVDGRSRCQRAQDRTSNRCP